MHNKKVLIDFRKEALDSLKIWFAETMEKDMIDTLSGVASNSSGVATYTFGTDCTYLVWNNDGVITTTTPSGLVAADVLTPETISFMSAKAKLIDPKMRPIRQGGKDYYVLLVHPESARELKNDSTWQNAQQYAMPRGGDNPLFSGALGMWDGVVVHEHDGIQKMTVNSQNANRNLFMGAQAGLVAFGGDHSWHEETVDRGNKLSVSASIIYEMSKAKFNSKDFGVIENVAAATSMT